MQLKDATLLHNHALWWLRHIVIDWGLNQSALVVIGECGKANSWRERHSGFT